MAVWYYTIGSTIVISLVALIGILTLYVSVDRIREWMLPMVGFAAGALLGNVFLELLPELVERKGSFDAVSSLLVLLGVLFFFLIEQGLRQWQAEHTQRGDHVEHLSRIHTRGEADGGVHLLMARPFAVVNLGGDVAHNFIDGLIVGGAFLVSVPIGLSTAMAVVLHEVPQELGDYAVLLHAGLGRTRALFYNFVTALSAVAGGAIAILVGTASQTFPLYLMPFTAGTFIYLAVGDLIPELHSHGGAHRTFYGVLGLLAGIGIMLLINIVGHGGSH